MTRILFFIIGSVLTGTIAYAEIKGPGLKGITESIADTLYARLAATNTFTKDQKIDDEEVLAGGTYSGMRLQTTERASYCLGPSDGQSNEFCISGGSVFQIHGSGGDLYDGAVTGNQILEAQPQLSRVWLGRTSSVVIAGGGGVPDLNVGIGGATKATATLEIDTTNDWTKHLSISAPAASECDSADEKGRLYFDDTANEFKFCNGTAWTSFGGGGGGGPTITMAVFDNLADIADLYSDSNIRLSYVTAHKRLSLEVLTLPSGSTNNVGVEVTCGQPDSALNAIQVSHQIYNSTLTTIATQIKNVSDNQPATAFCQIKAMDDSTWGFYEVTFVRASKQYANREHSIKVEKYSY